MSDRNNNQQGAPAPTTTATTIHYNAAHIGSVTVVRHNASGIVIPQNEEQTTFALNQASAARAERGIASTEPVAIGEQAISAALNAGSLLRSRGIQLPVVDVTSQNGSIVPQSREEMRQAAIANEVGQLPSPQGPNQAPQKSESKSL